MRRTTVDLEKEAQRILNEEVPALEEAKQELVSELLEEYGSYSDVPAEYRQTYDEFEEEIIELEGTAQALVSQVLDWSSEHDMKEIETQYGGVNEFIEEEGCVGHGESVIVIEELSTGQIGAIQDEVSERSFDFDPETGEMVDGTPKQGFGMVETLRHAIVKQPEGAPTRLDPEDGRSEIPEPAEYSSQVGVFLFDKVNSLNTVGDTDLGNSSLREAMKESTASSES